MALVPQRADEAGCGNAPIAIAMRRLLWAWLGPISRGTELSPLSCIVWPPTTAALSAAFACATCYRRMRRYPRSAPVDSRSMAVRVRGRMAFMCRRRPHIALRRYVGKCGGGTPAPRDTPKPVRLQAVGARVPDRPPPPESPLRSHRSLPLSQRYWLALVYERDVGTHQVGRAVQGASARRRMPSCRPANGPVGCTAGCRDRVILFCPQPLLASCRQFHGASPPMSVHARPNAASDPGAHERHFGPGLAQVERADVAGAQVAACRRLDIRMPRWHLRLAPAKWLVSLAGPRGIGIRCRLNVVASASVTCIVSFFFYMRSFNPDDAH